MPTHTSGIRHDVAELTERLGTGVAAMTEQLSASLLQYSHVALYRVDELAHLARVQRKVTSDSSITILINIVGHKV